MEAAKLRTVILDIEANALDNVTSIWCLVALDINTGEIFKFHPKKKYACPMCSQKGTVYSEEIGGNIICPKCRGRLEVYDGDHEEWREEYLEFDKEIGHYIGHNLIAYDSYWMNKILKTDIKVKDITDTLVLSRLFRPISPEKSKMDDTSIIDNRFGGHGLEAWGLRLGKHKIDFHEFDTYSDEQLQYCVGDVELNYEVYKVLEKERQQYGFSDLSIQVEHNTAYLLSQQERNGFYLDKQATKSLRDETNVLLNEMLQHLQNLFPPKKKIIRQHWKPSFVDEPLYEEYEWTFKSGERKGETTMRRRAVKGPDGYQLTERRLSQTSERIFKNWLYDEVGDGSYNLYVMEVFNPGSSQQIAERLLDLGWEPKKYTPTGRPATDKNTLKEVLSEMGDKYEEVRYLADYNIVADRHQKASKWLELVCEDGRVHGRINPIGAGTHRCSHYDDNMANIASVRISGKTKDDFVKETNIDPSTVRKFKSFKESNGFVFLSYDKNKEEVEIALTGREGVYGWESRSCWSVPPGKVLLGSDAAGIQLRALAHYMDDPEYTRKLLEEDIHTVNQKAAGIETRRKAKTFIYSFLLGAGDESTGVLLGVKDDNEVADLIKWADSQPSPYPMPFCKNSSLLEYIKYKLKREERKVLKQTAATIIKGNRVKQQFLNRTPALKRLKTVDIPEAVKRGYIVGLDGRKLWVPNEHLALSLYLQGFEAVVMKVAMDIWQREARKRKLYFKQVAFVHDEFQIETLPECAEELGVIVSSSFRKAGEFLGSKCPLDGDYSIGRTWAETH
jgi:DNA polymerase-1